MSMLLTELAAKGLEVMTESLPQVRRIGILWNPTTPSHPRALKAIEAAAEKLGIELRIVPAQTLEDFDGAFSTMTQEGVGGLLAVASPLIVAQAAPLAGFALKHRLPGMFPFKENVEAGGLISYGADRDDLYRRTAAYVDKIPTRFVAEKVIELAQRGIRDPDMLRKMTMKEFGLSGESAPVSEKSGATGATGYATPHS
jgi:putative ABC transport system substrate-binding protein